VRESAKELALVERVRVAETQTKHVLDCSDRVKAELRVQEGRTANAEAELVAQAKKHSLILGRKRVNNTADNKAAIETAVAAALANAGRDQLKVADLEAELGGVRAQRAADVAEAKRALAEAAAGTQKAIADAIADAEKNLEEVRGWHADAMTQRDAERKHNKRLQKAVQKLQAKFDTLEVKLQP